VGPSPWVLSWGRGTVTQSWLWSRGQVPVG
jgi:hypothetical protein